MKTHFFDKNRIINFTDAVFSIAMTLLVLEIAIPSTETIFANGAAGTLTNLITAFIGFFVSFLVAALYWIAHLRMMNYVEKIDEKMLWLNIFMLLFVVLLPFSTAFYVQGVPLSGPFIFYALNLTLLGFFHFLLVRYAVKTAADQSELKTSKLGKWLIARAFNAFIVWALAAAAAPFFPIASRFLFFLIFVFEWLISRYFKDK